MARVVMSLYPFSVPSMMSTSTHLYRFSSGLVMNNFNITAENKQIKISPFRIKLINMASKLLKTGQEKFLIKITAM